MPRLSLMLKSKTIPLLTVLVAALALSACDKRPQFSSIFNPRQGGGQAPAPPTAVPPVPEAGTGMALPPNDPALQAPAQDVVIPSPEEVPPAIPRIEPGVPRVAILLPLTGSNAAVGTALLNAAQLALFHFADRKFELLPQDTRGTAEGAADAAQFAIADGASLILGPLFNYEVEAVAPAARAARVKVIGFTSDKRVARDGVYVMGFRPDEQVSRVVQYAYGRGLRQFAFLGPEDTYGQTIRDALQATIAQLPDATLTRSEMYDPSTQDFAPMVRRLADYDARRAALLAQKKDLAGKDDDVSKSALRRLETMNVYGDPPFDALLIADGGKRLEAIAAMLPYYDIDPKRTRMLGTGLWDTPGIGREPALLGAWYAAPSPAARAQFEAQYAEIYGARPSRLATLAYDATALAALFAPTSGLMDESTITSPQGFAGRDGVFRFLPDGVAERGLAVQQINANAATEISAAPTTFAPQTN